MNNFNPIIYSVALPCDFGTTIFVPAMSGDILNYHVQSFVIRKNGVFVQVEYEAEYRIGYDAFLTYNEARKQLRENGWE